MHLEIDVNLILITDWEIKQKVMHYIAAVVLPKIR